MKPLLHLALLFLPFISFSQDLYFPPVGSNQWETLAPESLNWCPDRIDSLVQFLDDKNSKAFIILKDGKIVLEEYFDDFTQDSLWYWASAGKTITSFITGISQQEGYLDIEDATADYLGTGWTSLPPDQEGQITIRHQLTMTTGLDDGTGQADCTDPVCLQFLEAPGQRWAYHNAPYTLLTDVNENARGLSLNQIINSDLNSRIGLGGAFVPLGDLRVFFSKARGMARFGLLILNNGTWENDVIMNDQQYFNDMVNTSQNLNLSYGYLWWLNGKGSYMLPTLQNIFNSDLIPNAPADALAALGKNDQKIYVVPSENLVVIRMGESAGQDLFALSSFDNTLWEKINDLDCTATNSNTPADVNLLTQVFPNPATDRLFINLKNNQQTFEMTLSDVNGKVLMREQNLSEVDISALAMGMYFMKISTARGTETHKFIRH